VATGGLQVSLAELAVPSGAAREARGTGPRLAAADHVEAKAGLFAQRLLQRERPLPVGGEPVCADSAAGRL
jgi:hypothetical protein